jgi:CubicO group peptidase (beta-lactamase class C family)
MGASIAAAAIEKESGQPFEAYVRDAIFVPAGAHAAYRPLHAVYPVVDLWATAGDLGRLLAVIERAGVIVERAPLLTPASVDTMLKDHLGWQSIDLAGREVVGHEGEDRSSSTALFFDPKTKSGAVILTNGDAFASGDPSRAKALQDLLAELLR